ncbi:unnamed protein product [Paramecium pentaurelia]|uniref:PX domain-containing protein n=1 Tax=Paramecium pentaurelia TaxID=43138 RepID=A0A8S1U277_9CILI|nr:unnamed protein product [Paramecium pentaurelia]
MDQNDFEIQVEVNDPKIQSGINKYTIYSVRGMDKNGQFDVVRRFSDFRLIRQMLVHKWPGCYIPPLPPRKALGNMDQKFIDDRMHSLQEWMRTISQLKYFWYSEEFQSFIKVNGDIEKALAQVPKLTYEEIINKYQDTFTDLSGREINRDLVQKINDFHQFLRKVSPMMENFKQIAKNIQLSRDSYQKQLIHFLQVLLPEYEQQILLEFTESPDKLVIQSIKLDEYPAQIFNNYLNVLNQDEFIVLFQEIRKESKQLRAFLETMTQREKYEQQKLFFEQKQKELQLELQEILAGKASIMKIFSTTKKEDKIAKLQVEIDSTTKDIENMQFICDILTVLLGYIEIDKFKLEKQNNYYKIAKRLIQYEIQLTQVAEEFWERIQQNYNLL